MYKEKDLSKDWVWTRIDIPVNFEHSQDINPVFINFTCVNYETPLRITLRAQHCQKYQLYQKGLQIKVIDNY